MVMQVVTCLFSVLARIAIYVFPVKWRYGFCYLFLNKIILYKRVLYRNYRLKTILIIQTQGNKKKTTELILLVSSKFRLNK